jgi:hypothetical protein
MQNVPLLLGGFGCLLLFYFVFVSRPGEQDESLQAADCDEEEEDMPPDPPFID